MVQQVHVEICMVLTQGGLNTLSAVKTMYCYLPAFLCLFESFRRDLNEVKVVYISDYYLV